MWENIVQPDRPRMTIERMRITWWVTKATNTHSQYVTLIAFPVQLWLNKHASMLRYTYIGSIVCSAVGQEIQAGGEAVTAVGRH
jgi:hypothetical protein